MAIFWLFLALGAEVLRGLPGLGGVVGVTFRECFRGPYYTHSEALALSLIEHVSPGRSCPSLTQQIPSGIFDNSSLEWWLRTNLVLLGLPDDFKAFKRQQNASLWLSACDLDTVDRVIFGADEKNELTISQAVQAWSALPIF